MWNISTKFKKNNILIRLFYIVLAFLPAGFAWINSVRHWVNSTDTAKGIIALTAVMLLIMIWRYIRKDEINVKSEIITVVFFTIIAFWLRIIVVEVLNTYPVSDPGNAYWNAQRIALGNSIPHSMKGYYAQHTHWGTWVMVLSAVMRVFGATLDVARTFTVLLSTLNIPLYYYAAKIICKNSKIAIIAMMLITISPGMICYSGVLVNDHMTDLFVVLYFIFLALGYQKRQENNLKKAILYYVFAALSLGGFECFKLVALILLLATAIGEFVINIVPGFGVFLKERNIVDFLKRIAVSFVILLMLFLGQKGVLSASYVIYEKVLDLEIYKAAEDSLWSNLYMGLNLEYNGTYAGELALMRNTMRENYPDPEQRNEIYKEMLFDSLDGNGKALMDLFVEKFGVAWGDEVYSGEQTFIAGSMKYNTKAAEDVQNKYKTGHNFIAPVLKYVAAGFWAVVTFGALLGAIVSIKKKTNYSFLISMIYLFGFTLLMELMLVQGRYKEIVYFPLIMLASYGYYEVITMLYNKMVHLIKKEKMDEVIE